IDVDAGSGQGIIAVVGPVESALAIDRIVAAAAGKLFHRVVGIVGAADRVVEHRARDRIDAGEAVVSYRRVTKGVACRTAADAGPAVDVECHGDATGAEGL